MKKLLDKLLRYRVLLGWLSAALVVLALVVPALTLDKSANTGNMLLSKTVNNKRFTVEIPKEANIPDGTELVVLSLDSNQTESYKNDLQERLGSVEQIDAYDISLVYNDSKIEPSDYVKVSVSYTDKISTDVQIVHYADSGEVEEITDKTVNDKNLTFKTNGFSIYAIVNKDGSEVKRLTVKFQNKNGSDYTFVSSDGLTHSSQTIKHMGALHEVGIPIISEHEVFQSWREWNEDTQTFGSEIEFDKPISVTETKTIVARPYYAKSIYLTLYSDETKHTIHKRETLAINDGKAVVDLSGYNITPPRNTLSFIGWTKVKTGEFIGKPTAYELTEDEDLIPAFEEALRIDFVTGDVTQGAPVQPSVWVGNGKKASVSKPADPVWDGYTFTGWYEQGTNTLFDWNKPLTANTTLEAKWKPANSNYTVIFWQQSKTDSKDATDDQKTYEYAGQATYYGTVEDIVKLTSSDKDPNKFKGFSLNTNKSYDENDPTKVKKITPSGQTKINVYYDRDLVTFQFYYGYSNGRFTGLTLTAPAWETSPQVKTMTGLYGTTLEANGYVWDPSFTWTYWGVGNTQRGMTYLGEFILPDSVATGVSGYKDGTLIRLYAAGTKVQELNFIKQKLDGTYDPEHPDDIGSSKGSSRFNFSDKYVGFTVKAYQIQFPTVYNDTGWSELTQTVANAYVTTAKQAYNKQGVYTNNFAELRVYFERNKYKLIFTDPVDTTELQGIDSKTVLYEESLSGYKPTATPISKRAGYVWDGKWYKDAAQTEEFDFNITMPTHDMRVFAGWKRLEYKVEIDTNGGVMPEGESTDYTVYYAEKAKQISSVERLYVEDANGTYYQAYNKETKHTYYTDDASDPNIVNKRKYAYDPTGYKLIGWYRVMPNGGLRAFSFNTPITSDVKLKAMWRRVGDYSVAYSTKAVDENGKPINVTVGGVPVDEHYYDDGSGFTVMKRPTEIPEGYRFRGWYLGGTTSFPGDGLTISSSLADYKKVVTLYPILKPIEKITVKTVDLTYNANGGIMTENNSEVFDITHQEENSVHTLKNGDVVKREGYTFKGWNTNKEEADKGIVRFEAGLEVGIDNQDPTPNVLYAVWEKAVYNLRFEKAVEGSDSDKDLTYTFTTTRGHNFGLKDGGFRDIEVKYQDTITFSEQVDSYYTLSAYVVTKGEDGNEIETDLPIVYKDGKPTVTITITGDMTLRVTNKRAKQKVRLQKVDGANHFQVLEGAVFNIYKIDDNGNVSDTPLYENLVSDSRGYLTRDSKGYIDFAVGRYAIREVKSPNGFNPSSEDAYLTVSSSGVQMTHNGQSVTPNTDAVDDNSIVYALVFTNKSGVALPSTGGLGETGFVLLGLTLALGCLIKLKKDGNI